MADGPQGVDELIGIHDGKPAGVEIDPPASGREAGRLEAEQPERLGDRRAIRQAAEGGIAGRLRFIHAGPRGVDVILVAEPVIQLRAHAGPGRTRCEDKEGESEEEGVFHRFKNAGFVGSTRIVQAS